MRSLVLSIWSVALSGLMEKFMRGAALSVNHMRTVMQPYSTGGAYLNYTDALIKNWPEAYYGNHYEKLQQLRRPLRP